MLRRLFFCLEDRVHLHRLIALQVPGNVVMTLWSSPAFAGVDSVNSVVNCYVYSMVLSGDLQDAPECSRAGFVSWQLVFTQVQKPALH
jgi:hypothetical protein